MVVLASGQTSPANGPITLIGEAGAPKSVWIEVAPLNRSMRRRAHAAALRLVEGEDLEKLDNMDLADLGDAFSYELLRLSITAWGGVLDDATGGPAEITPPLAERTRTSAKPDRPTGTIDGFLSIEEVFEAADRLIVIPIVRRDAEKNGSSALSNGTGKAATQGKNIAGSPARPKARGGARNARTASTSPRPRRAKKSSTS